MSDNLHDSEVPKNKTHTRTIITVLGAFTSLTGIVFFLFIFGLQYIQISILLMMLGGVIMRSADDLTRKIDATPAQEKLVSNGNQSRLASTASFFMAVNFH